MPFFHFVYYFFSLHIVEWVKKMRIVIYDSGYGLLPFYFGLLKLKKAHTYFLEMEDKLFPLGEKSEDVLSKYAKKKLAGWKRKKVDHVYVICNTFSLILKKVIHEPLPFQMHYIIDYTLKMEPKKQITLMGTCQTTKQLKEKGYILKDASDLVRYIEEQNIIEIIRWLKAQTFSTPYLLLACTHFSHIAFLFAIYFPQLILLDPYQSMLKEVPPGKQFKASMNKKARRVIKSFQK